MFKKFYQQHPRAAALRRMYYSFYLLSFFSIILTAFISNNQIVDTVLSGIIILMLTGVKIHFILIKNVRRITRNITHLILEMSFLMLFMGIFSLFDLFLMPTIGVVYIYISGFFAAAAFLVCYIEESLGEKAHVFIHQLISFFIIIGIWLFQLLFFERLYVINVVSTILALFVFILLLIVILTNFKDDKRRSKQNNLFLMVAVLGLLLFALFVGFSVYYIFNFDHSLMQVILTCCAALAGGGLTMYGVVYTIKKQEKQRLDDFRLSIKPKIVLDKSLFVTSEALKMVKNTKTRRTKSSATNDIEQISVQFDDISITRTEEKEPDVCRVYAADKYRKTLLGKDGKAFKVKDFSIRNISNDAIISGFVLNGYFFYVKNEICIEAKKSYTIDLNNYVFVSNPIGIRGYSMYGFHFEVRDTHENEYHYQLEFDDESIETKSDKNGIEFRTVERIWERPYGIVLDLSTLEIETNDNSQARKIALEAKKE